MVANTLWDEISSDDDASELHMEEGRDIVAIRDVEAGGYLQPCRMIHADNQEVEVIQENVCVSLAQAESEESKDKYTSLSYQEKVNDVLKDSFIKHSDHEISLVSSKDQKAIKVCLSMEQAYNSSTSTDSTQEASEPTSKDLDDEKSTVKYPSFPQKLMRSVCTKTQKIYEVNIKSRISKENPSSQDFLGKMWTKTQTFHMVNIKSKPNRKRLLWGMLALGGVISIICLARVGAMHRRNVNTNPALFGNNTPSPTAGNSDSNFENDTKEQVAEQTGPTSGAEPGDVLNDTSPVATESSKEQQNSTTSQEDELSKEASNNDENQQQTKPTKETIPSESLPESEYYYYYYYDDDDHDPTSTKPVTYRPGRLVASQKYPDLRVSVGMECDLVAQTGQPVHYRNGTYSRDVFHPRPDAAGVFKDPSGGWIYVSNSEDSAGQGGVAAIHFDKNGHTTQYQNLIPRGFTRDNCGGGMMPWNTWVSCEEHMGFINASDPRKGQCWQVDPTGQRPPEKTVLGMDGDYNGLGGGNFESVAVDYRDVMQPRFFVTEDRKDGALRRYTPGPEAIKEANGLDNPWVLLHRFDGGSFEYLVLVEVHENLQIHKNASSNIQNDEWIVKRGTFAWTTNKVRGRSHATEYFPYTEGIEVVGNILYFVSKSLKLLYTLDLDMKTFVATSTRHGNIFDGQPDQVRTILGTHSGILYTYFTEDSGSNKKISNGIHGRDQYHRTFTIIEGRGHFLGDETTGLSFSPDLKFMYVAWQKHGSLFSCFRLDGQSFVGRVIDTRYHHSMQS